MTVGNKEVTLHLYDTAGECTRAQRVPVVIPRFPLPSEGISFLTPKQARCAGCLRGSEAKRTSAISALSGDDRLRCILSPPTPPALSMYAPQLCSPPVVLEKTWAVLLPPRVAEFVTYGAVRGLCFESPGAWIPLGCVSRPYNFRLVRSRSERVMTPGFCL